MHLIGLTGYAGTGKDTVAGILHRRYGYERVAFADAVRTMALAIDPLVTVDMDLTRRKGDPADTPEVRAGYWRLSHVVETVGWDRAKRDCWDIRELLQRIGTDAGRLTIGPNIWVDLGMRAIKRAYRNSERIAVTDVRFPNEAAAIIEKGGWIVRVRRPGFGPINGHPSETAMDDIDADAVVDNVGTLAELEQTACELADRQLGLAPVIPFRPRLEEPA